MTIPTPWNNTKERPTQARALNRGVASLAAVCDGLFERRTRRRVRRSIAPQNPHIPARSENPEAA
jgi:hypothetical protein